VSPHTVLVIGAATWAIFAALSLILLTLSVRNKRPRWMVTYNAVCATVSVVLFALYCWALSS
jgi:hypothetical protein